MATQNQEEQDTKDNQNKIPVYHLCIWYERHSDVSCRVASRRVLLQGRQAETQTSG